jgi:pimeloyl-ACP methyl ester carboxylesterase
VLPGGGVIETVVRFGSREYLTGIVTAPSSGLTRDVGLLVLNAGLVHRVGPNRVGVEIARSAAAGGVVALRFDFSNLGDSRARIDSLPVEASAVAEVQAAMDELGRTHGLERFVLFGICSGAEHALRASLEDPRIVGAVMVDGYAYRTPGYYLHYYGPRLFHLGAWRRRLAERGPLAGWFRRSPFEANGSRRHTAQPPKRRFPPRARFKEVLDTLTARGVELLLVYTGEGMADHYSYEGQFFDAFPEYRGRSVEVVFLAATDHLFSRTRSRAALAGALQRWANRFATREAPARVSVTI